MCRTFVPRIRLYGLRHLKDASSADDLVQDVLAIVVRSLREKSIDAPSSISAYVFGVCKNVVRDRAKKDARRNALASSIDQAIVIAPNEAKLDLDRVGECIQRLNDRDKEIVVRTYMHEEDTAVIAESMGIEPGTVRVLRFRAIARLRELLKGSDA